MMCRLIRRFALGLAALASTLLFLSIASCGGGGGAGGGGGGGGTITVTLTPTTATVALNGQVLFTATVTGGTPTDVTWTATSGTIAPTGPNTATFTAPGFATTSTIRATSVADPTKFKEATVTTIPNGSLPPNRIFYGEGTGSGTDVFHVASDGSDKTLFLSLPANIPTAISNPAGTLWAFFYTPDPLAADPVYDVYVNSSPSFAGATRLTTQSYIYSGTIQFTGDGSKIVFTASSSEGEFGIYTMNPDGSSRVRIGDGEEAHVHPLTGKIVATVVFGGAGDIQTMNLDGSSKTTLNAHAEEDWMPQWSKDGGEIAFSSRRSGDFDIWIMSASGANLTRVTTSADNEFGPSFNSSAAQIAFAALGPNVDFYGVYRIDRTGSNRIALQLTSSIQLSVYWSSLQGNRPTMGPAGPGGLTLGGPMRPRLRGLLGP